MELCNPIEEKKSYRVSRRMSVAYAELQKNGELKVLGHCCKENFAVDSIPHYTLKCA